MNPAKLILKIILPLGLRHRLRLLQKRIVYNQRKKILQKAIAANNEISVILGAAMTKQPDWYSTNEQWLDITNADNWKEIFQGKKLIRYVMAEHVFEHLTYTDAQSALQFIREHMAPKGRIRIAVPDGYHPDPTYIKHVGIAGIGADAEDHKQLLTCDSLTTLLAEAGFSPH